jgi:hypothetical protein
LGVEVEEATYNLFAFTFSVTNSSTNSVQEDAVGESDDGGGEREGGGGRGEGGKAVKRFECLCETVEERDEWVNRLRVAIRAAQALHARHYQNRYEIAGLDMHARSLGYAMIWSRHRLAKRFEKAFVDLPKDATSVLIRDDYCHDTERNLISVKKDLITADKYANPQKSPDTEEMLMNLEGLERNLQQFRLTNKNGRYSEMLAVRERRTKIRNNAARIIQRATRIYLEKIHRRPWLEYRRVKASNIHELAGFSEHGASSADIPLRYLSFQIASSAPRELRVPPPRKAIVGIPGLAGHLGVRGLREGAPGKTLLKPQTLIEALLSGTQGICTPPTTPGVCACVCVCVCACVYRYIYTHIYLGIIIYI